MRISCCGFGHRNLFFDIREELQKTVEYLICEKGVDTFYTGDMGEFDAEYTNAVRRAKSIHKSVKIILIKPYFSNELNTNKKFYKY